jgi:hypothetical protein
MSEKQRCEVCEYSQFVNDDTTICRRFPPIYRNDGAYRFPEVFEDSWCGEYKLYHEEY